MTDLQRLADALATDYLHGRWHPEPTEEHRTRNLSAGASADGGLATAWAVTYGIEAWREAGTGHRIRSTQKRTEGP